VTLTRPAPAVPAGGRRPAHGGLPARAAVLRWSWRLLRREWRRQVLLLALIACTAAAAVSGLTATHAYQPSPAGTFGSARQILHLDIGDPAVPRTQLTAARAGLGPVEIIAHRKAGIPGSAQALDIRAQDPHGRYGSAMLGLRAGRWPAPGSRTETALTGSAAGLLRTGLGRTVALDGQRLTVVGIVENPGNLDDVFALTAPGPDGTTVAGRTAVSADAFAAAPSGTFDAFRHAGTARPAFEVRADFRGTGAVPDAFVFVLATVALLLVSLVAAAGFAAVAQRRLRQVGMLAALGATDRQVRLVLLGHGALTGVAASAAGTAVGIAAWLPLAPHLEAAAGHRIDRFAVPWALIALMALIAVLAPTAAAWWPARAMARIPAVQALSARPPRAVAGRQSAWSALILTAAGIGCLIPAHRTNPLLMCLGIAAVVLGTLLLSPLVIRALAAPAGRAPFTTRLVLRDLGRHQARSGAALAAVTLAIGIAVAVSALAAASQDRAAAGNLSTRQVLFRTPARGPVVPLLSGADIRREQTAVQGYATALGGTATPLLMAYDPHVRESDDGSRAGTGGQPAVEAGTRQGPNTWASDPLYVATPAAAQRFGLGPAAAGARTDVVTTLGGHATLSLLGAARRGLDSASTVHVPGSAYSSVPRAFLTESGLRRYGWRTVTVGWFVSVPHDLIAAQTTAALDLAVRSGLVAETRDHHDDLATLRWASMAAGAALALGVLAMTVGTIRAEAADDLRTLTATGAASATRRALTAVTAGSLAVAGTVLGTLGAYTVLVAAFADDLSQLHRVPYVPLAAALLGVPLIATAAGWTLAGRQPSGIARRLLE
jgi:putative ABC transport system permease protein